MLHAGSALAGWLEPRWGTCQGVLWVRSVLVSHLEPNQVQAWHVLHLCHLGDIAGAVVGAVPGCLWVCAILGPPQWGGWSSGC